MFQTDQPTAASSLPAPAAAGTPGFFTGGNPASGTPATILDADFLNMVMMELVNVVGAAGETPSKTTYNQVVTAIKTLIGQPQNNLVSGVVGQARNAAINIAAASTSVTFTADEFVVESALGGVRYCLPSVNITVVSTNAGANGVAAGSTMPTTGFAAIYVAVNPTTGTVIGLIVNATSAKVAEVCPSGFLPSGYTASGLAAVLPVSASQFAPCYLENRTVSFPAVTAIASSGVVGFTSQSIAALVPLNARRVSGGSTITINGTGPATVTVYGRSTQSASYANSVNMSAGGGTSQTFSDVILATPQTIYYSSSIVSGTISQFGANIVAYTF